MKLLQELLDASEWVVHVAHGIGKSGDAPSSEEMTAALDNYKAVTKQVREYIRALPNANRDVIDPREWPDSVQDGHIAHSGFGTSIYVNPAGKVLTSEELPEELRFKPIL